MTTPATEPVNTKKAERRTLSFASFDDVLADVEAIGAGARRATGNWTPAQNVEHVALAVDVSVDGFPRKGPFFWRVGKLFKGMALKRPTSAGLKFPARFADVFTPPDDVTWDDAVAHLRRSIERARAEGMTAHSPILGSMTNADWELLHYRHAELHLGFIHPELV